MFIFCGYLDVSSWASIAAGSTTTNSVKNHLLKRLVSEEMRRSMASMGASYFVEGALAFDDEPSFPINDEPSPTSGPQQPPSTTIEIQEDFGAAPFRRRADSGFAEQQHPPRLRRNNTECGGHIMSGHLRRRHYIANDGSRHFRNSCSDFPNLDVGRPPPTRRTISMETDDVSPTTPSSSTTPSPSNKGLELPTTRRNTGSTSDYHSHSSSLSPKTDGEVLWPKSTSTPIEEGKFVNFATDEFDLDRRYVQRRPKLKSQLGKVYHKGIATINSGKFNRILFPDHVFDELAIDLSEKEELQNHHPTAIRKLDERRRSYVDVATSQQRRPRVDANFHRKSISSESPLIRSKSDKERVIVHGGYSKWKWKA